MSENYAHALILEMLHSHFLQARGVLLAFKGRGQRKKYGLKRGGRPKKISSLTKFPENCFE